MNSIFDIAGMGMTAQNVRLNTVASNLANAQSAASSVNQVYRARHPVFAAVQQRALAEQAAGWSDLGLGLGQPEWAGEEGYGVRVDGIVESQAPLDRRYEPGHPLADGEGYVYYPNVNVVEEMADMISASRAFQVNVELMQSAKTMSQRLLSLGQ
jgi:flagellar basal-body rod protein FlgC